MKTKQRTRIGRLGLSLAAIALLAGCETEEQTDDSAENQTSASQSAPDQRVLGQEVEFDDFTLRASISPTRALPAAMAQEYSIEPNPDLVLLNLVILENRPDRAAKHVSAEVRAQYESLIGHVETIDMRAVEANGLVSYIGTLDTSSQRSFQLMIEAQPAGTDELLDMDFEVQL